MSGWRFSLIQAPALRVDLRGITPAALAPASLAEVERHPVGYGNAMLPLAEFFKIEADANTATQDTLSFDADLSRFDRVGWQMSGGRIEVELRDGSHVTATWATERLVKRDS